MVNSADFAKRLEKIFSFYGITATAFAEEIDFNRSTISHLLSGRNKPSLEFVMQVVKKFPEVDLYWLLNGSGAFPSEESKSALPIYEIDKKTINRTSNQIAKKEAALSESAKIEAEIDRIVIFYKNGQFKIYEN